jgi:hypothetical protein
MEVGVDPLSYAPPRKRAKSAVVLAGAMLMSAGAVHLYDTRNLDRNTNDQLRQVMDCGDVTSGRRAVVKLYQRADETIVEFIDAALRDDEVGVQARLALAALRKTIN